MRSSRRTFNRFWAVTIPLIASIFIQHIMPSQGTCSAMTIGPTPQDHPSSDGPKNTTRAALFTCNRETGRQHMPPMNIGAYWKRHPVGGGLSDTGNGLFTGCVSVSGATESR